MVHVIIIVVMILLLLLLKFLSAFLLNILLVDNVVLSIALGIASKQIFSIHPAFALLVGILIFIVFYGLSTTKVGFWIISVIMSLAWGTLFMIIAYVVSKGDDIWAYVIWGLGFVLCLILHITARPGVTQEENES